MTPMRYPLLLMLICLLASLQSVHAQCDIQLSHQVIQPLCFGDSNGSINLTATNGTAPYTYLWSNNVTTEDLSGLAAGVYTCTVTDVLDCTATTQVTVNQPTPLTVSFPGNNVINCFNFSVTLDAVVSGGTPPYSYFWWDGTTNQAHTFGFPGAYDITVTDLNGCTATGTALVTDNVTIPVACVSPSPVLTCATPTVTLNGQCSSTGPNFTVFWSTTGGNIIGGTNTLTPVVDADGVYTLTVMNTVNGCTSSASTTVTSFLTFPTANAGPDATLTCSVNSLSLDGSGSSQGPNYVYTWMGIGGGFIVAGGTTQFPIVNAPGTYFLTVTDVANGCTATDQVFVNQDIVSPVISPGIADVGLPCGGGTVQLQGSPPFGGGFTYMWIGPGINAGNQNDLNPVVSLPGTYSFILTNTANGCTSSSSATVFAGPLLPATDLSKTNISCFGLANGLASVTPSLGQAPYDYVWTGPNNYSNTGQTITNLPAGTYVVAATDALDCTYYGVVQISQPQVLALTGQVTPVSCPGGVNGSIILTATGGTPPYSWPIGTPNMIDLAAGVYSITLTDVNACTALGVFTVPQPPGFVATTNVVDVLCGGGSSGAIDLGFNGGTPPYTYLWSNGATNQDIFGLAAGTFTVTVADANTCFSIANVQVQDLGGLCGALEGRVYHDINTNCLPDAEPGLGSWILRAEGAAGTFFGVTDANGQYNIGVLPGDYNVFVVPPSPLWIPCVTGLVSGPVGVNDTLENLDFPVQKSMDCPQLTVNITSGNLRRCFSTNFFTVHYGNNGTAPATDAFVLVSLDPFLDILSAGIPYVDLGGGVIQFELGDLDVGEFGSFYFYAHLNCDAALGQTHCTEAHIYPDTSCLQPNVLWSGASLQISSECDQDSVRFQIKNVGTGNMPNSLDYIVIEDLVMLMGAPVQLNAGEFVNINVPANGSTWRLEVEQEPFHPGLSSPAVSVEGCTTGTSFSTGFVNVFPPNDADEFIDIHCLANTAAFDPNDKQGFPLGYGTQHYVRPGTRLDYQIRFQNTGNDTAFTVRIVDTLSAWLDPSTFRPGASSHPYTWDLSGAGVVSFLFENILLPDSNINEPGSHGFIKFEIDHRANAPLETVIENTAEIYFDFNDPIVTNTTYHRLGENFLSLGLWQPKEADYAVTVSPNPFSDATWLEVKGLHLFASLHLQVFDLQGLLQLEMDSGTSSFQLQRGQLPKGVYLFKIEQSGRPVGTGKLVVQD